MSRLRITLLGAFQATLDGEPLTAFGTDKARALLAYLAVESHRPHRREHLAGMLWSDQAEKKALHSLRQSLSALRKTVKDQQANPPYLLVNRDTIQFNPESNFWLDTTVFRAFLDRGLPQSQHGQAEQRPNIRRLNHAVSLYQGNFLDQMILRGSPLFDEWAILQREILTRQAIEAMCLLIDYYERRGEFEQACKIAEQIVALIPWEENAHRIVMRMLAQARQWSAVEVQYQNIQRYLAEDLGVEPSPETAALMEEIRESAKENSALPSRFSSSPTNLPLEKTPFVGRETELNEFSDLLASPDCRLITLAGPGGIGKSRLALQVAREQVGLFGDGVFYIPLTAIGSANLLTLSIAEAIGFSFYSPQDPKTLLIDHLRQKSMLLILDNFEHLLVDGDQAPELITEILTSASGVTILVTSRQQLNLRIEQIIEIGGLTYPTSEDSITIGQPSEMSEFSALQLFNQVAIRVNPKFSLEAHRDHVTHICDLVEGLPLGIELAATWTRGYSTREIPSQIKKNLDFLATSMRDVPDRHRSLRTVFNHSWHLLDEAEKAVFQKLTVFKGSFSRTAAEAITGATPDQIISLIDQSLLRQVGDDRFDMHGLLRQFASEKLEQDPFISQDTLDSHSKYFANLVHNQKAKLFGRNPIEAQNILSLDIENVRASWQWATTHHNVSAIARAARGLGRYYDMRSWFTEGREAFSSALESIQETSTLGENLKIWALITTQLGWFEVQIGNYQEAQSLLDDQIPKLRNSGFHQELSSMLNVLGSAVYEIGELVKAESCFLDGLSEARKAGCKSEIAFAANYLGSIARIQGDFTKANQWFEESLEEYQRLGDTWGTARVLNNLGSMAGISGDYAEAERIFQESLSFRRELEDQAGIAGCLHNLSNIAYIKKDFNMTRKLRLECLEICKEIGFTWGISSTLKHLGDVEKALGNLSQARIYYLESLEISETAKNRRSTAFTLTSLGNLVLTQGNILEARQYFMNALKTAAGLELAPLTIDILIGIAGLWRREERYEQAYLLLAEALNQPGIEEQTKEKGNLLKTQIEAHLSSEIIALIMPKEKTKSLENLTAEILEKLSSVP